MSEKTIQAYAYLLQSYIHYLKGNGQSEKNISLLSIYLLMKMFL